MKWVRALTADCAPGSMLSSYRRRQLGQNGAAGGDPLGKALLAGAGVAAIALSLQACGTDTIVVPTLSATCSASPDAGAAPLRVSFTLDVAGAEGPLAVSIRYGDGATGADVSAPHVYDSPGSYTASFDVSTPTQSALCSASLRVDPPPAPTPTPAGPNRAPTAVFATNPLPGAEDVFSSVAPLTIAYNMCRSSDPEGDLLDFRMDLDGDGRFELEGTTGGDCRASHDYEEAGTFRPRICVTDLDRGRRPAHPYQCHDYTVQLVEEE
jgi:hypothetical protein